MRRRGPSRVQPGEDTSDADLIHGNLSSSEDVYGRLEQQYPYIYGEDDSENVDQARSLVALSNGVISLGTSAPANQEGIISDLRLNVFQPTLRPQNLGSTELLLLGNYVQRFSRSYPTCSEPTNPFLSVFLPLAMQENLAMDSLLLLSSAQATHMRWPGREKDILRLRHKALRGIRELIERRQPPPSTGDLETTKRGIVSETPAVSQNQDNSSPSHLVILACVIMLFLHEKLSGEANWKPHFDFIQKLGIFEHFTPSQPVSGETTGDAFQFFHSLFLYNDLVRATSLDISLSSTVYIDACRRDPRGPPYSRYYFPSLISRISFDDLSVSESDIAVWDGDMTWLPSFALSHSIGRHRSGVRSREDLTLKQLYQTAAIIYMYRRRQSYGVEQFHGELPTVDLSELARQAVDLSELIPISSPFENALLWPLGIAARQLTSAQHHEREVVLRKFEGLEQRLGMRHFQRVRHVLAEEWTVRDSTSHWRGHTRRGNLILLG